MFRLFEHAARSREVTIGNGDRNCGLFEKWANIGGVRFMEEVHE